jgi:hypothetical protein
LVRTSLQRRIRRSAERDSHPARTSYILATRRGERAAEAEQLEHGLLTYVLLRGMGEPRLRPLTDVPIFDEYPSADLDHDGWVQTGELRQYVDMAIPVLAQRFPGLVHRGGAADAAARPDSALTQQFEGTSFPLIEIMQPPPPAGAR